MSFQQRLFVASPLPWRIGREFPDGSVQIMDANEKQVMVFHGTALGNHITAVGMLEAINQVTEPFRMDLEPTQVVGRLSTDPERHQAFGFPIVIDPNIPPNQIRMIGAGGSVATCNLE